MRNQAKKGGQDEEVRRKWDEGKERGKREGGNRHEKETSGKEGEKRMIDRVRECLHQG